MPKLIQVIESELPRGEGVSFDPCRIVVQYHTTTGELLAENDPCAPERDYLIRGDCFTRQRARWYRGTGGGEPVLVFDGDAFVSLEEWKNRDTPEGV